jgi:hypothetical protein
MVIHSLVIALLISVSFIEASYEKGHYDGTELARHIYSLSAKDAVSLRSGLGQVAALREFLKREPAYTSRHMQAFEDFKDYYAGFLEAFTTNEGLYGTTGLQSDLKEWVQTLYDVTYKICHSALEAETFAAADREHCALMKESITNFLSHTRPALQLPVGDKVVAVPTNPFYVHGQTIGRSLSTRLIAGCAAFKRPSGIWIESLENLKEPLLGEESSAEERKQAFNDLKQFFVGLQEQFSGYTPQSIEASCRDHYLPECLIERCKIEHDYVLSTIDLILGSSGIEQMKEAGENLVRYYESLLMADLVRQCVTYEQLHDIACSIEEDLIFAELLADDGFDHTDGGAADNFYCLALST